MTGKLKLISEKAKQDKKMKFTSLAHLINEENLAQCYKELKKDRACGIDGVTVEEYGQKEELNGLNKNNASGVVQNYMKIWTLDINTA